MHAWSVGDHLTHRFNSELGTGCVTAIEGRVLLVSSDGTVLETAGREVAHLSTQTFFRDFHPAASDAEPPRGLTGRLDKKTREQLERLRRGE